MEYSKYNIFSKLRVSEDHYLVNLLSGEADLLDAETAAEYRENRLVDTDAFVQKGYLVEPAEEQKRFRLSYLDFIEARDTDEVQLFFVPTYGCNFACPYCYQDGYGHENMMADTEIVDAFFAYVDSAFADRQKYITVFGGEPLLPGEKTRKIISSLIEGANSRKLGLAFVTNGFTLEEYVPLLKRGIIREVQVTLDGVGEIHDSRRPRRGGQPSFDRIVTGIDAALAEGIPINLRTVVDRENFDGLIDLARFAIDRGWTKNPLFKTQLGRNYELHYCQAEQSKLYDRLSLYEDIYKLAVENPEFLEYHRPAFSISRFLFENGELPDPLFDSCPGTKTEWAFDYTGHIYSCTATVGKPEEALGTYYPEVHLETDKVDEWDERDVTAIPKCRNCELQLACGGGCASVAKNLSGTVLSPDCRPVKELLELGLSLYGQDE
ncbi:MAG: radical SAM protein [Spirochaetales bacterium]|jgi:uncharacterized protein|nr:radical SAM protein [Spirochaetales bacterium]